MSAKSFIAAGDVLINPALVAYATVATDSEGPTVCLGFAGQVGEAQEVRLRGFEARSVLRWLRKNAEFLDSGGSGLGAAVVGGSHEPAAWRRPAPAENRRGPSSALYWGAG